MKKRILVPFLLLACGSVQASEQLLNLIDAEPEARFEVSDISWPAAPGEAEICLWKDDKVAPVSFTVDDNISPDVPWWLEQSKEFGLVVTWFIITDRIGGNSGGGTWELWREVLDAGHDVQSHTHSHLHIDKPEWKDIEWEYTESKTQIETNLPGHRARFLAYPGGPNSKLNDPAIAAKYYAGARGVTGTLVPVSQVPYMGVRAIVDTSFDNPEAKWADPKRTLDPDDKMYRGWTIPIYHFVKDKEAERPLLAWCKENSDKLWMARFGDVSLYGQERDTATLNMTANSPTGITFTLTDRMDDKVFDYPLTIKVRLPDSWGKVIATQDGKAVEAKAVLHEGAKYALVQAVPDRGEVILKP